MNNKMLKKLKKRLVSRALPLLLAALMVLPSAPLTGISAGEDAVKEVTQNNPVIYDYDTLKLTVDGEVSKELSIYSHEKIEVNSKGLDKEATYQWQIKHPEKNNLWVDIYDAKSDNIGVSVALINNMLAEDGTAKLRLRAYTEDYAYLSNTLTVKILEESSEPTLSVDKITSPRAMAGDTSETPEFVTVTIEYERYEYHYDSSLRIYKLDYMGPAFSSYIATLQYGKSLNTSEGITIPAIVGFEPALEAADGISKNGDKVFIDIASVTKNITFTIKYIPKKVDYEVRYRFQNIYDDSYVTNSSLNDDSIGIVNGVFHEQAYTGLPPYMEIDGSGNIVENNAKKGVYAEFKGFTALYYQPDTIAADGSTVFEVFYERNYYLMEFDCAGGYGSHTLYVRHGTYIYVPDPIKAGYVFRGWDMIDPLSGTGDGVAEELPATMPTENTSYVALWKEVQTTYTVVYWIDNGDGTKTYIGSRPVDALSASTVSGNDDLRTDTDVCGLSPHQHNAACVSCVITEHTHSDANGCYENCTCKHDITCYTTATGIAEANGNTGFTSVKSAFPNPTEGVIYRYKSSNSNNDSSYHNYIYIGETWYYLGTGAGNTVKNLTWEGTNPPSRYSTRASTHINAPQFCKNDHADSCLSCAKAEHSHDEKCYCKLTEHSHDSSCKFKNAEQVEFIEADQNVTVEGDGSTVINVYYKYPLYTLRFYYARSSSSGTGTVYSVVGGTTYPFGTYNSLQNENTSVEDLLGLVTEWGDVTELPTINSNYSGRYNTGDVTYGQYTYYYLEFTAPFGAVLENLWPIGIFNSVDISETHSQCSYKKAYFSAWNGEFKVKYTQDHASRNDLNETIKGLYMYLDEDVVYDTRFEDKYTTYVNPKGESTRLVNFLGFWDNGANISWSIPRLYRYHLMIESLDGAYDREYNGKFYDEYKKFDTYDDTLFSKDPNFENQTYTAIAGMYKAGRLGEIVHQNAGGTVMDEVDLYFFYDYEPYEFSLYNYNAEIELSNGLTKTEVDYSSSLKGFEISAEDMQNNYYPEGVEPGAYEFGGWYATPECYDGTEVNWDTLTMPDGNLTLYAKWTPVVRNVYFHLLYTDVNYDDVESGNFWYPDSVDDEDKADYYPIPVPHGELLGTTYSHTPTRGGDYQFIGWFYFDENGKKKFAPDSMKVTRDLILFAEWHSSIVTTYEVEYKAYTYVDGGSGDTLSNDEIAAPLNDYSIAGKTVTFNAKGGKALYTNYQKGWFPNTSSHSILMDSNSENNTYTFKYYKKDYINYKVMYINRITGDVLGETNAIQTENAIVTEKFKPFAGYIPEEYYIEHSVAFDPTDYSIPENKNFVLDENIIYFYYIPDTENALHRFEHYIEALDGDYNLHSADQAPHKIGDEKTANVITETGFELIKIEITSYSLEDGDWVPHLEEITVTDANRSTYLANGITRAVTLGGLDIKFYYDRISYDYTIQYVKDVDTTEILWENTEVLSAKFGETVEYTAVPQFEIMTGEGEVIYISADSQLTKSKVISDDESKNVITFIYSQKRVLVVYHIVCDVDSLKSYNSIDIANESVTGVTGLMGCTATPGDRFIFVGWFSDEECENSVTTNNYFKPATLDMTKDEVHYYAKFIPKSSTLVISNDVAAGVTDTFLFHIQGDDKFSYINYTVSIQGQGDIIIKNIPQGTYTVTALTDWSREYGCDTAEKTLAIGSDEAKVIFTHAANGQNWLGGEQMNENQFPVNN